MAAGEHLFVEQIFSRGHIRRSFSVVFFNFRVLVALIEIWRHKLLKTSRPFLSKIKDHTIMI